MQNIYILTFLKPPGQKFYFTNIAAIYQLFSKDDLHITYDSLVNRGFSNPIYKNKFITIEKIIALNSEEAKKLKEKREEKE